MVLGDSLPAVPAVCVDVVLVATGSGNASSWLEQQGKHLPIHHGLPAEVAGCIFHTVGSGLLEPPTDLLRPCPVDEVIPGGGRR